MIKMIGTSIYEIFFANPAGLEAKLVETFDRIRTNQSVNFSELIAHEGAFIYDARESYSGNFASGSKTYKRELDIKDFERRLIEYLERNKKEGPKVCFDLRMNHCAESHGSSKGADFHGMPSGTSYRIRNEYKLDGLIVTYTLEDGVLMVKADIGYGDEASKSFEEIHKLIDSIGRRTTPEKVVSLHTFF